MAVGPAPAQNAVVLDELSVAGQGGAGRLRGREDPLGPVRGLAAERSATATKTATPLVETPQAISVIGREQLDLLQPRSVLEAVRYSPGVTDSAGGSDTRTDLFQIRGFGATPTAIFLDGLQLPSPNFAIFRLEPFGLERLEILRGPTSVLYGGGNPGGIINAISKRPTWVPIRYVEAGVNSFGNGYGAFDVGGPIEGAEDGTMAYRVVGLGRAGGTEVDFSRDDRAYIAPSFKWRPDADTQLTILGSYQNDRANSLNFLPYIGTARPAPFGFIARNRFTGEPATDTFTRSQALIGYEFEHRLSDAVAFRQNARYSHLETRYDGVFGLGYAVPPTPTSALLGRRAFRENPVIDVFNVDNQVESRFATGWLDHTLLAGLDYRNISLLNRAERGSTTPIDLLNPVYGAVTPTSPTGRSRIDREQLGLYLQDQIRLGGLSLLLGGRQDFVSTRLDNILNPAGSAQSTDSARTGRAALIYNFENGIAPYVSYATSFEPQLGLNSSTGQLLKPEGGEQYEAGVKYQPPGYDVTFGFAAFDLTRTNVAISDGALGIVQRGAVRSRGVEVEVVARVLDGLSVIGAITSFDNETIRDSDPANIGKTPPGTITELASLYVDYTVPAGDLAGFGLGAGARYVGPTPANAANTLLVSSSVVADAGLHYVSPVSGLTARLSVQNLFDNRYVAECASESFCFYGQGRRVALIVGYRW